MTVWFDTRDLRRDDTDVWVLAGAQQVIAKRVWVRRRGEFVATWRAKVVSRQGAYGEPTRFRYKDLLSRVTITRWRPVDPSRFPDPLPKPARIEGDAPWQSKAEPVIPPESVDEFEWPGPYNLPPNIIAREAQVRNRARLAHRARPPRQQGPSRAQRLRRLARHRHDAHQRRVRARSLRWLLCAGRNAVATNADGCRRLGYRAGLVRAAAQDPLP